jgi:hypothetical protein
MGRLTLRLPDSLHRELESRAESEKVSLNQYLVYLLTRQVATVYTAAPMSEDALEQQKLAFEALLRRLGRASSDEVQRALAAREQTEPEPDLDPALADRMSKRILASSTIA